VACLGLKAPMARSAHSWRREVLVDAVAAGVVAVDVATADGVALAGSAVDAARVAVGVCVAVTRLSTNESKGPLSIGHLSVYKNSLFHLAELESPRAVSTLAAVRASPSLAIFPPMRRLAASSAERCQILVLGI